MDNEARPKRELPKEKEEIPETVAAPEKEVKTESSLLSDMATVRKYAPFGLFLGALAMFYIWNAHRAEKLIRNTDKIKQEIKELRAEYLTIKSDLEYRSKQSQIAKKLEERGLQELRTPPYKITYNKKDER